MSVRLLVDSCMCCCAVLLLLCLFGCVLFVCLFACLSFGWLAGWLFCCFVGMLFSRCGVLLCCCVVVLLLCYFVACVKYLDWLLVCFGRCNVVVLLVC